MRRKSPMFSILMLLLVVQIASGSDNPATTETAPRAVFVENTWQFEPVIEGTEVIHDFSVKNQGGSPLEILNVKTS